MKVPKTPKLCLIFFGPRTPNEYHHHTRTTVILDTTNKTLFFCPRNPTGYLFNHRTRRTMAQAFSQDLNI